MNINLVPEAQTPIASTAASRAVPTLRDDAATIVPAPAVHLERSQAPSSAFIA
jgi:hypothetical protein